MSLTEKQALRRTLLGERAALTDDYRSHASQEICKHLIAWFRDQGTLAFDQVLAFYPYKSEPDLSGLFLELASLGSNVRIGLPIVGKEERSMSFHAWRPGESLLSGPFGVKEPPKDAPRLTPGATTLILVPAVALDTEGYRLGYGGGYYDTYLAEDSGATTVGVIFGKFLRARLPREPHDRRVSYVATEFGVSPARN